MYFGRGGFFLFCRGPSFSQLTPNNESKEPLPVSCVLNRIHWGGIKVFRVPCLYNYAGPAQGSKQPKCPKVAISATTYRGAKCPTLKTAEKTAEKGAEWVTVKQPKNSRKTPETPKNSCFDCFSGVSGVFPAVFRLFYRDPLGTLFGCFFGCFQCRAFGTSVGGRRDCNPKVLKDSAKSVLGLRSECPQNSLLHGARPYFRPFPLHGARDPFGPLGPKTPKLF